MRWLGRCSKMCVALGVFEFWNWVFCAIGRKSLCSGVLEFGDCARTRFFCAKVAKARESRQILIRKPIVIPNRHRNFPSSLIRMGVHCYVAREVFRIGSTLAE